jgi:thiol-disulfide isomerase/thioredoxin
MEQNSRGTSVWKQRLLAFGLGVSALILVYAVALFVSNDVRLIYASGAILLLCSAMWLGAKGKGDWFAATLLFGPLLVGFSYLVLPHIPLLWPDLVLWAIAVAIGLVFLKTARARRNLVIVFAAALFLGSLWYCIWYVPEQLARSFNRFRDLSAPAFTLQPISDRSVPVAPKPGKILVIDFFSTSCVPCIAELPELTAARADLINDVDVEFVLVASDRGNDTPERFRSFAQRRHVTLPLAFDPGGKAHDEFGLSGVPALVVLDRTGRVRLTREGYNAAETTFRSNLVQFLKTL